MKSGYQKFMASVLNAHVDLKAEKRRMQITKGVQFAAVVLAIGVAIGAGAWAVYSNSPDRKYEQMVEQSKGIVDSWERFTSLSKNVDPNAWARAWPSESDAQAEWASETYLALEDAIKKGDQRAIDYVTGEKYGKYVSLNALRDEVVQKQ